MIDTATYTKEQVRNFQRLMLEARRNRGLNQTQVANQIGVSQTLISNLERGPSNGMRVGELFRVLSFYHIEPNMVAEILGYWDGGELSIREDPQFVAVMEGLASLPDELYEQIIAVLQTYLRGASEHR